MVMVKRAVYNWAVNKNLDDSRVKKVRIFFEHHNI